MDSKAVARDMFLPKPMPAVGAAFSGLESFKRQESTIILLNLAVIACLVLVHVIFLKLLGPPSTPLLIVLALMFLALTGALTWVQGLRAAPGARAFLVYSHLSIWANLLFAFLASYLSGAADSHYSVLLVLPIVSAAFKFSLPATLSIAILSAGLTFLEVWVFFRRHPPPDITEYFEAATVGLIFLVVGVVTQMLVNYLRMEESKLKRSLAELRQAQERLIREEKLAAIGRLSSAIAHEIRNPVAMISSSLSTADRSAANPELRKEMLSIATQEAGRLERLTGDFLSYARFKPPELKVQDVSSTLEYVASLARARAADSSLTVDVECPDGLSARMDLFQIQQAMLNLVVNAFESTEAGGRIATGATQDKHAVRLYVENSGNRIHDSVVSRIFEPFFTTKNGGTGLGLAIVRNIAQAHGGDAALAVNEPGRVRFEILLPQPPSNAAESTNGK